MSKPMKIEELERAVADLSAEDLGKFRTWFAAFDAERFDRKIEQDALSGRIDAFADEAIADLRAGRARKL